MNKVILEIGIEEVPSLYIDKALKDLKNCALRELQQLRIECAKVQTYGTPRRFIVYIEDINSQQKNTFQQVKGPSKSIAFDMDGNPQNPVLKFAQTNQLKLEELITEKTKKGEYVFAKKLIKGKKTELLLPELCLKLINSLNFPKSMRWNNTSFRFIRPIRWLLALYNEQLISFKLETVNSDRITYGHRLLSPESIIINSTDDYFKIMEECFIIIDPEKRKNIIYDQIRRMIEKHSAEEHVAEMLLNEVKNLVEYPRVLLGQFDKHYLELPSEVLEAVMIKHQKYFPVYAGAGNLSPLFLVVINGNENRYKDTIIQGNERVLRARLEDARFFYQEDQKTDDSNQKPLDRNLKKLKSVVYQENLGSIYNKVERLIDLTEKMGDMLQVSSHVSQILKRSAQLCKSDLVSEMVKEFPELQGIMGKEYALLQGESEQVAIAIFEHYLPKFSDDNLPKTLSGCILSITDKLDNITACFMNRMIPDGSQDPYALRRQALGILNIILNKSINFSLDDIIDFNIRQLLKDNAEQLEKKIDSENLRNNIKDFILQRFRHLLLEKGYRYDVIDAVLIKRPKNIIEALSPIQLIQETYHTPGFMKIITAATRTFNLSKNADVFAIDCSIFQEKEEQFLYDQYLEAKEEIEQAISQNDYKKVFDYLEEMTVPVDTFFDHVLVMDEDISIRNNRLTLLKKITEMYHSVADLSKIALAKGKFK
jgi:glycyl-tRNA synthetase beta chain